MEMAPVLYVTTCGKFHKIICKLLKIFIPLFLV